MTGAESIMQVYSRSFKVIRGQHR